MGCHGGEEAVSALACQRCHGAIAQQRARGVGFHGQLAAKTASRCETCHVEHFGDQAPLVGEMAFRRAGYDGRDAYRHQGLDFALSGAHLGLACAECHENAERSFLHAGETRFLGLDETCTRCHVDAHEGRNGRDCASCHGQERPFPEAPGFVHPASFPLRDGHANLACDRCHGERATNDVDARCAACHLDDRPRGTVPDHLVVGFPEDCAGCHRPTRWKDATFDHRFPIDRGLHRALSCAACHPSPAGTPTFTCTDCHAHRAGDMAKEHRDVADYAYASPACLRCHPTGTEREAERGRGRGRSGRDDRPGGDDDDD
jgi:hypothetical protein